MDIKIPEIDENKLAEIKKEKMKELLEDPDIQEIINHYSFSNEDIERNLYNLALFQRQNKLCKNCLGIDKCNKIGSHLIFEINVNKNNDVLLKLRKCPKQIEIDQFKDKYIIRHFEDQILYEKLKNCLDYFALERTPLIKELMKFKNNPNSKSIYTHGTSENGKSYILSVFSVFLAKLDTTNEIAFINCEDQFKNFEELFATNVEHFNYSIDQLKEVQYLFIDDLGKEFKTKITLEKILYPIISYRIENNLPTFISSKYSPSELPNLYGYGKELFALASKLSKLLIDNYVNIPLNGLSFSILK